MISTVIKRNGTVVDYNRDKIVVAITKANREVKGKEKISREGIKTITTKIENLGKTSISIEEIQDIIETCLMEQGKFQLAKKYMLYREKHNIKRAINTTDDGILQLIQNKNTEVAYENSNKNARTISTQRDLIAGETSKDITRK